MVGRFSSPPGTTSMRCLLASSLIALLATATSAQQPTPDEALLTAAGLPVEPAALVKFFAERTPTEAEQRTVAVLIRQLGDDAFDVREQATATLAKQGPGAVTLLRLAAARRDGDVEIVRRCEKIIEQLAPPNRAVFIAAARVLARKKPVGAAGALLNYLPFADDVMVIEEVRAALPSLALAGDKPDPALTQALQAASPVIRAAAAEALVRGGAAADRQNLRRFLTDADATVRLRVGLSFVEKRDKDALPALIAVLGELPQDQVWQVEELLSRLAGEQAPTLAAGADRRKVQAAWADWWTRHGAGVELAKLDEAPKLLG